MKYGKYLEYQRKKCFIVNMLLSTISVVDAKIGKWNKAGLSKYCTYTEVIESLVWNASP